MDESVNLKLLGKNQEDLRSYISLLTGQHLNYKEI